MPYVGNADHHPRGSAEEAFGQILAGARADESLLRDMQLKPEEAGDMLLLPPELLRDVRAAIMHFSHGENSQGMVLLPEPTGAGAGAGEQPPFVRRSQKVPGPVLCTRLLELLGVPHYYRQASSLSSSPSSPTIVVHSSQVDPILQCCLETARALSRSCDTGKFSLIGSGLNLQPSLAATAEEIWRCVWNMRITYTSGREGASRPHAAAAARRHPPPPRHQQVRIGRVGSIGMEYDNRAATAEYLSAPRGKAGGREEGVVRDHDVDPLGTTWEGMAPATLGAEPLMWSPMDQRRYNRSVVLFNSVLAAYAKLSSSASGLPPGVRREMVQSTERLLLEVASRKSTEEAFELSPSTILHCLTPDAVSFNTTIKAWCEYSPREAARRGKNVGNGRGVDEDSAYMTAVTAQRTESVLGMMQDLWDEERAGRTTLQCMRASWDEHGDAFQEHAPPPKGKAIAPNLSSYNGVMKAWSRSADPKATIRALRVYQMMIGRGNVACLARESLMLENSGCRAVDRKGLREGHAAFPDSRTFVALLQSFQNLSLSIGFRNALDAVELIYGSAKQWDEQLQWSIKNGIAPTALSHDRSKLFQPIMNVFSYNTMIKTLSKLPTNWEENYQCCLRIDDIVEEVNSIESMAGVKQFLPNVIAAWSKCAERASADKERARLCTERASAHVDALLADSARLGGDDSLSIYLVPAINDLIRLYGSVGLASEADDLFLRARDSNAHNLGTLSAIIDALCENGFQDIAHVEKAHQYLSGYEQDKMRMNQMFVFPEMKYTRMYNALLDGYLNCNLKRRGLEHAQAVLSHMISSHESNPRHIARPNTTSFARVMSVMAQRGDNTQRLEELLSKMEALHQRRKDVLQTSPDRDFVANVIPNIVIYNLLLKAYARSNSDEALQSAMKLLGRMEKDPDIRPDKVSNSYIMTLLSRKEGDDVRDFSSFNDKNTMLAGPSLTSLDIEGLDLSDLNLNGQNLDITSKSFNSIMNVHATKGTVEGAKKAEALLHRLEALYSSGEIPFRPDIFLYNKLMNAWSSCEENNEDPSISPAENAQEILNSIFERCEAGGEPHLTPNDISFSICIHAWCKSKRPDAIERAEQVLRQKEAFTKKYSKVQIRTSDYNSVILKCKDDPVTGPDRAELLFEEMLLRYGNSDERSQPTAATLNTMLDVYAKGDAINLAEKAECLLNRMNQLHQEGKGCIIPDVISYRSVIDAWIRRWHPDAPQKVEALVNEMIHKYENEGRSDLRPDSNSLNLVLKACSHAPAMWHKNDIALKGEGHPIFIANRVFSILKGKKYGASASATHSTYSFMFNIYRQHMDFQDKRYRSMMQNIWKHCCRDGLVSDFTLCALRDSTKPRDFWEAIGGRHKFAELRNDRAKAVTAKDLPTQWSRNVVPLKNRGKAVTNSIRR